METTIAVLFQVERTPILIENLDACVGYEVSERAVNEKDNNKNAVISEMTTETAVN
jgi:hypothetical protein